MKKIILILLILSGSIFGFDFKSIHAKYEVKYGYVGKIAEVDSTIDIDGSTYKINIDIKSKGIVGYFSSDRREVYKSTGIVSNGVLIPTLFVKTRSWGEREEKKRYFFKHKEKTVSVLRTSKSDFKTTEDSSTLSYYSKNDILTLFFNLNKLLGDDLAPAKKTILKAVGANKNDGHLSVKYPNESIKKRIKRLLKKDDNILIVTLDKKIFSSRKGEFYININKDHVCDSAVLKDVFMTGDLVGKIKKLEVIR